MSVQQFTSGSFSVVLAVYRRTLFFDTPFTRRNLPGNRADRGTLPKAGGTCEVCTFRHDSSKNKDIIPGFHLRFSNARKTSTFAREGGKEAAKKTRLICRLLKEFERSRFLSTQL